jgi:hypothetical protein
MPYQQNSSLPNKNEQHPERMSLDTNKLTLIIPYA